MMMNATERQAENFLCLGQIMTHQYCGVIFENRPEHFGHIAPVLKDTSEALNDLIASNPIDSCSPATQRHIQKLMALHCLCTALTDLTTDVGREPDESVKGKISSAKYFHEKCLEEYFLSTEDENSDEDPNMYSSSRFYFDVSRTHSSFCFSFDASTAHSSFGLYFDRSKTHSSFRFYCNCYSNS
eukprot:jgi/Psemu1/23995/gm1.23995_g